jgi:hypothetical protein
VAGLTTRGLVAPWVLDGAIGRDASETCVAGVLVPEPRPGDIAILDNPPGHKGPKVRMPIEAAGARLLYLPPHSPGLNPVEMALSKRKAPLPKAAEPTLASPLGRQRRPPRRHHPTGLRQLPPSPRP